VRRELFTINMCGKMSGECVVQLCGGVSGVKFKLRPSRCGANFSPQTVGQDEEGMCCVNLGWCVWREVQAETQHVWRYENFSPGTCVARWTCYRRTVLCYLEWRV
jgi:hypothetical protein